MVCKVCLKVWGEDPSLKFDRLWLQAWFFWWVHRSKHPGCVDLPSFGVLDFAPWYSIEASDVIYEDDDVEEDYDDIWDFG